MNAYHLIADRDRPGAPLKPSIGRIAFWLAFALAIYLGITRGDVPVGVQWLIGTVLAYCGAHKFATRTPPEGEPLIASPVPTPAPISGPRKIPFDPPDKDDAA